MGRIVLFSLIVLLVGNSFLFANAQTQTEDPLIKQLLAILEQLKGLEAQLNAISPPVPAEKEIKPESKLTFRAPLKRGMRGEEVKRLQETLAQYPGIYPEGLVTGYFGPATERAIKRFEGEHNLEQNGLVTREIVDKFNEFIASRETRTALPDVASVAPSTPATPAVPAIPATPATPAIPSTPAVSAVPVIPQPPTASATNITTPTKPGLPLGTILPGGDPNDTTPPKIYDIKITNIDDRQVNITWKTDESATTWVESASDSNPSSFVSGNLDDSKYILNHSINYSHPVTWKPYYLRVRSWDVNGNLATSEPQQHSAPAVRQQPPILNADYAKEWPDRNTACIKAGGSPGGASGCIYQCPSGFIYSDTDPRSTGSTGYWYGCTHSSAPNFTYPIHYNTCWNKDGVAFVCSWFVPKVEGTTASANSSSVAPASPIVVDVVAPVISTPPPNTGPLITTVTVPDTLGPLITSFSVSPTNISPGGLVTFSVTAEDPSGIGNIVVDIKYPNGYYLRPNFNFAGLAGGTKTFTETIDHGISPTLIGEYIITTIRAVDSPGNVSIYYPNGTVTNSSSSSHQLNIPSITIAAPVLVKITSETAPVFTSYYSQIASVLKSLGEILAKLQKGPAQVYSSVGQGHLGGQAKEAKAKKAAAKSNLAAALERELRVLLKQGNAVGPQHIQRMWNDLLGLWQKGYLTKQKAQELYNLLAEIYWRSNPKLATASNAAAAKKAGGSVHQILKETKEEVAGFSKYKMPTKEHYHDIVKKLAWLAEQGAPAEELAAIRQSLEQWNPEVITKGDQARQATREQEEKQRANQVDGVLPSESGCNNNRPVITHDFTDFSKIVQMTAPGTPTGDRDVAKGHFWVWTEGARVPLYTPIDAILESMGSGPASAQDSTIHHGLTFRVKDSCSFVFRFGHITEPDSSLTVGNVYPAGSLVGHTVGNIPSGNWDIGWYDLANPGPLAAINAFGMHAHGLCLVDYYSPEKQSQLRALLTGPRTVCSY